MTKTELQSALAEATQTDKRTAGVFLDTLSAIAYKDTKKIGEFVVPGFGKLAQELGRRGHRVSHRLVAELLHELV